MPTPDNPLDPSADAARISPTLTGDAATDYGLLTGIAAACITLLADERERPIDTTGALRELREGFLAGRTRCRASIENITTSTLGRHVVDEPDDELADKLLYALDTEVTASDLEAAILKFAPELVIATYSPEDIDTLDDLVSALYAVTTELAKILKLEARPLDAEEWNALDRFFLRGLLLIANYQPPATPDPSQLPNDNGNDVGGTRPGDPRSSC